MQSHSLPKTILGSFALLSIALASAAFGADQEPEKVATQDPYRDCLVVPGSMHCYPRHGFSLHTNWDRRNWAHPKHGYGGAYGYGGGVHYGQPTPWPLSNVDIEIKPKK